METIDANYFKGKRVTVFGIGLLGGGVGTIRYLVEHGAKVIATDIKTKEQLAHSIEQLSDLKNIEYVLGQHRREDFTKVDMVIKTPVAPWNNKHIKLALEHKIPVEVDASLFFKLCKAPIIGVTGTKGKTTTAHMIYTILERSGRHPLKVGIGQTSVLDRLKLIKKNTVVVFELSSWRLSALKQAQLSPQIAIFTNIFPDHMDYYGSMEKYLDDKKNIYRFQKPKDWFIVNCEDKEVCACADDATAQVVRCGLSASNKGRSVYVDDETIYINDGNDARKLVALDVMKLRGKHNIPNVLMAIGAAYAYGAKPSVIADALREMRNVPHRLEFVREKNGIKYYNDTASTVPRSAMAALDSFEEPIIFIAGGSDKKLHYEEFAKKIKTRVKGVVFIKGVATDKIISEIKKQSVDEEEYKFAVVDAMDKAVEYASRSAEAGDVVLLSPGAASFGVFRNEFDRGNQFKRAVDDL